MANQGMSGGVHPLCRRGYLAIVLSFGSVAYAAPPRPHAETVGEPPLARQEAMVADLVATAAGTCPAATTFRTFDHYPIGSANLNVVSNALVVSNLGVVSPTTTCTAPPHGAEACLGPASQPAGDLGLWIEQVATLIPTEVSAYSVELGGYWGRADSTPPWVTDPIPIGFRTGGGSVTACADFDVCPIYCNDVEVRFVFGPSTGTMVCPAGDLFSVADSPPIALGRVVVFGRFFDTGIAFVFDAPVANLTPAGGCTVLPPGSSPFNALAVIIRPTNCSPTPLDACSSTTCCSSGAGAAALGGTTPPILSVKLLAESFTSANAAATVGQFVVSDEAICTATEIGACSDGVDNDCDLLVDGADPDCHIPTMSTWGIGALALALCIAATLLLRRAKRAMVSAHSP